MPNLFAALRELDRDSLAAQAAFLEVLTPGNAIKPHIDKVRRRVVRGVNQLLELLDKETLAEPSVTELKDAVRSALLHNRTQDEARLQRLIHQLCVERTGSGGATETALSVAMIDAAGKLYDLDDLLTPSEKVEAISQRYQEETLANLRKTINKMTPEERAELERTISEDLARLSPQERERIQRDLKLDELSGKALTQVLLTAGGPMATLAAVSATGFGAYLALTTIIHAIATTMLGITLPFGFYTGATTALSFVTGPFAFVILGFAMLWSWGSAKRKLNRVVFAGIIASAAPKMLLPSSMASPSTQTNAAEADHDAAAANRLKREADSAAATSRQVEHDLAREQRQLTAAIKNRTRVEQKLQDERERLQSPDASSLAVIEVRVKQFDEQRRAQEQVIAEKDALIARLTGELDRSKAREAAERDRQTRFENTKAKQIVELWTIHFPKLQFEPQPARWMVHKRHGERVCLERTLMELQLSDDPVALSRGKLQPSGDHHLRFRIEAVECRLQYRMRSAHVIIVKLGTNQKMH